MKTESTRIVFHKSSTCMSRKNRFVYRTAASDQQGHCVFFYLTMQEVFDRV